MRRRFAGLSDPGLVRPYNQDNYYIDAQGRYFVVADGMGGYVGGQEASEIAIEQIRTCLDRDWDTKIPSETLLVEAIAQANRCILDDQSNHPERRDMGTTAVVLMFRQGLSWCAHVGDSRLYLFRDRLHQVSEDDTWVAMALRAGELNEKQAKIHPWRHVLSKCLGREDLQSISVKPIEVTAGDRLLLCSDGLTEEVPDEAIAMTLQQPSSLEQMAADLVEQAKKAGGSDNITVIVVAEESPMPAAIESLA